MENAETNKIKNNNVGEIMSIIEYEIKRRSRFQYKYKKKSKEETEQKPYKAKGKSMILGKKLTEIHGGKND